MGTHSYCLNLDELKELAVKAENIPSQVLVLAEETASFSNKTKRIDERLPVFFTEEESLTIDGAPLPLEGFLSFNITGAKKVTSLQGFKLEKGVDEYLKELRQGKSKAASYLHIFTSAQGPYCVMTSSNTPPKPVQLTASFKGCPADLHHADLSSIDQLKLATLHAWAKDLVSGWVGLIHLGSKKTNTLALPFVRLTRFKTTGFSYRKGFLPCIPYTGSEKLVLAVCSTRASTTSFNSTAEPQLQQDHQAAGSIPVLGLRVITRESATTLSAVNSNVPGAVRMSSKTSHLEYLSLNTTTARVSMVHTKGKPEDIKSPAAAYYADKIKVTFRGDVYTFLAEKDSGQLAWSQWQGPHRGSSLMSMLPEGLPEKVLLLVDYTIEDDDSCEEEPEGIVIHCHVQLDNDDEPKSLQVVCLEEMMEDRRDAETDVGSRAPAGMARVGLPPPAPKHVPAATGNTRTLRTREVKDAAPTMTLQKAAKGAAKQTTRADVLAPASVSHGSIRSDQTTAAAAGPGSSTGSSAKTLGAMLDYLPTWSKQNIKVLHPEAAANVSAILPKDATNSLKTRLIQAESQVLMWDAELARNGCTTLRCNLPLDGPGVNYEEYLGGGANGSVWRVKSNGNIYAVKYCKLTGDVKITDMIREAMSMADLASDLETKQVVLGFEGIKVTSLFRDKKSKSGEPPKPCKVPVVAFFMRCSQVDVHQAASDMYLHLQKNPKLAKQFMGTSAKPGWLQKLVLHVGASVARALSVMVTRKDLLHRDVKPENSMVDGRFKSAVQMVEELLLNDKPRLTEGERMRKLTLDDIFVALVDMGFVQAALPWHGVKRGKLPECYGDAAVEKVAEPWFGVGTVITSPLEVMGTQLLSDKQRRLKLGEDYFSEDAFVGKKTGKAACQTLTPKEDKRAEAVYDRATAAHKDVTHVDAEKVDVLGVAVIMMALLGCFLQGDYLDFFLELINKQRRAEGYPELALLPPILEAVAVGEGWYSSEETWPPQLWAATYPPLRELLCRCFAVNPRERIGITQLKDELMAMLAELSK